jgi:hypothetical protein
MLPERAQEVVVVPLFFGKTTHEAEKWGKLCLKANLEDFK